MKIHLVAAFGLFIAPGIGAQVPNHKDHAPAVQANRGSVKPPTGELTLQGCLEHEASYHQTRNVAKGGALGSGLGQENQSVLTMGKPVPGRTAEPMKHASKDCATTGTLPGTPGTTSPK